MAAMAAEGDGKGTVVVVGAGIAGLSAALAILQSDDDEKLRVLMLEARERPGGRTFATQMPGTDVRVDAGAMDRRTIPPRFWRNCTRQTTRPCPCRLNKPLSR